MPAPTIAGAYDSKTPVLNNTTDATSLVSGACQGMYFGAEGNVKVTTVGGTDQTLSVVTGTYIPIGVRRVWDTGTSLAAASIHVLYGRY
jgi:hypothetical protein